MENTTESSASSIDDTRTITEVQYNSQDMTDIIESINERIDRFILPPWLDRQFIGDMIAADVRSNLQFYRVQKDDQYHYILEIDEYNSIYMPFEIFLNSVVPSYLHIQCQTTFSELTSINELVNDIASTIQDELEQLTIAVSEDEFKNAAFDKKSITDDELIKTLTKHTYESKISDPLDECPLCSSEAVHTFYECRSCKYQYCEECCKEIASRQSLCPCCRKALDLTKHTNASI